MITVDPEGYIVDISEHTRLDASHGTEFYSGLLVPGFVNAHTHLELSYLKGAIPPGGGFEAFAAGMRENRGRFTQSHIIESAAYQDARMWAEGTSAVGDISNGVSTFEIKKSSPIRYHTFAEAFGLKLTSATAAREVAGQAEAMGLSAGVTPHSTYSLNDRAMLDSVEGDQPLSIHFMESVQEQQLFENRGEMKQWYDRDGLNYDFINEYDSPTDRIVQFIAPERRVMLVHNTCVGESDARLLTDHYGENLTWVLCSRSNEYISGVHPPVDLLRASGARIALGTDSLASNTSLSMIDEIKALGDVPLADSLRWATLSGAETLGIDRDYGSFEVGKRPGVVLIEGIEWEQMRLVNGATSKRLI